MKNLFMLLMMSLLAIACNGDDDTETTPPEEVEVSLLGTWQLIEQRFSNDAGGPFSEDELPFYEVESENTVTFYPDNTITSNSRVLCANIDYNGGGVSSGVYSLVDSTYTSNDCANPNYKYPFTQTDSIVIISYPYNGISEGKFKKIADLEE
ncbi:hypothetical protein SCB49_04920 [unidentified eubacterium SCB49]|nr:hypothetical protein SCB49_04920 [unidentified eubacterium SCB49]